MKGISAEAPKISSNPDFSRKKRPYTLPDKEMFEIPLGMSAITSLVVQFSILLDIRVSKRARGKGASDP